MQLVHKKVVRVNNYGVKYVYGLCGKLRLKHLTDDATKVTCKMCEALIKGEWKSVSRWKDMDQGTFTDELLQDAWWCHKNSDELIEIIKLQMWTLKSFTKTECSRGHQHAAISTIERVDAISKKVLGGKS